MFNNANVNCQCPLESKKVVNSLLNIAVKDMGFFISTVIHGAEKISLEQFGFHWTVSAHLKMLSCFPFQ